MVSWAQTLPEAEVLWDLAPEELAGLLLQHFREEQGGHWHLMAACSDIDQNGYPNEPQPQQRILRSKAKIATREAWHWLEAQGFLIPDEGTNGQNGWRSTSRRADAIDNFDDFVSNVTANRLPKELLHNAIKDRVWSAFVRGEFDVAVFQSMKAVEVLVRETAGYGNDIHGTELMRRAFHADNGPLRDPNAEPGEKEALSHLFAGVYGYFRNPNAHREVPVETPEEAIEMVMLANHLLRIVDAAQDRLAKEAVK